MMDRQTVLTAGVVALMTGVGVIFAAVSARLYKEPVEPVMCTPATVVQEQPAPARQQGGMPQDVQELNLSDVQKTKIRVIVQRFRPQVTSAREKQRSQYEQRVEKIGYTDLMVDGAPSPHQSDTTLRWLIDRLRS